MTWDNQKNTGELERELSVKITEGRIRMEEQLGMKFITVPSLDRSKKVKIYFWSRLILGDSNMGYILESIATSFSQSELFAFLENIMNNSLQKEFTEEEFSSVLNEEFIGKVGYCPDDLLCIIPKTHGDHDYYRRVRSYLTESCGELDGKEIHSLIKNERELLEAKTTVLHNQVLLVKKGSIIIHVTEPEVIISVKQDKIAFKTYFMCDCKGFKAVTFSPR